MTINRNPRSRAAEGRVAIHPASWKAPEGTAGFELLGKRVGVLGLGVGQECEEIVHAAAGAPAFLVASVLEGSLRTPMGWISEGEVVGLGDLRGVSGGDEGCVCGLVAWAVEPPRARPGPWRSRPTLRWYPKYQARVGMVICPPSRSDGNPIAPWSAYSVEVPPVETDVPLHVHHEVHNLVFVRGPPNGRPAGHLVVEDGEDRVKMSLRAGDMAVVRPHVRHNLVAFKGEAPMRFFVFNNSHSGYEEEQASDFHVVSHISLSSLTERPRGVAGRAFIEVS